MPIISVELSKKLKIDMDEAVVLDREAKGNRSEFLRYAIKDRINKVITKLVVNKAIEERTELEEAK